MKKLYIAAALLALSILAPKSAEAATLKVCATCTYTTLQPAIDAALAGDTILLQGGATFTATHVLKNKSCPADNATCIITIRTGVDSSGTLLSTSLFPAAGVRITPSYASNLAKLKVLNNNEATITTNLTTAPVWYQLQWLEFLPNTYGGNTLIQIGSDSNAEQPSCTNSPNHIYFDQIYVHGDPVTGQFRGLSYHGRDLKLTNSYFEDIKATSEGQAVWLNSAQGPFLVENNYLSGGTETFFTGGSSGSCRPSITVASNATTTSAVLSAVTELEATQDVQFTVAAAVQSTQIQTIGGSTCTGTANANCVTFSPALTAAPDVPGSVKWGARIKNLTFRYNTVTRPLAWRNAIVGTPASVTATASDTGGALAAGTYYYRIVARQPFAVGTTAISAASAEVSATVTTGTAGSIAVSWAAVQNATQYYVYAGSSGGENRRYVVTAPTTTFTDVNGTATTEAVPTGSGTKVQVKNVWEVKNLFTGTVQYNDISNSWVDAQQGYCVLFTGSMQSSGNPSASVRDVTFRDNAVHGCAGFSQITGRDALGDPSGRAGNIKIINNLVYDLGTAYGGSSRTIIISTGGTSSQTLRAPYDVTIDHNTFDQNGGNAALYLDTYRGTTYHTIENFIVTNNIFRRTSYGLFGNAGEGHITEYQGTGSSYNKNVFADASCAIYPTGTYCPTSTALNADFVNYAGGDYNIKSTSLFYNAGTDGKSIGVDMSLITAGRSIALSGNNSGAGTTSPLVIETAATLPNTMVGSTYVGATIAVSGGTPTYTRSITVGALPAGLSMVPSTGVISGTATTAGTYTFTVRATDAAAATVEKVFTLVVGDVPTLDKRPGKIYLDEGVLYRRPTPPAADSVDQLQVGDLWSDLSTNTLKLATATTPSVTFTTLGSTTDASLLTTGTLPDGRFPATLPAISGANLTGLNASNLASGTVPVARLGSLGTASSTTFLRGDNAWATPAGTGTVARTLMFVENSANWSWTMPSTAGGAQFSASNDIFADLTGVTECRIFARTNTVADGYIWVKYSTGTTTADTDLGTTTETPQASFATTTGNFAVGAWTNIATAAKTFVRLGFWGFSTTGATNAALRNVGMVCR